MIADSVMITQAFPFELKTTIFDFVVLTFNYQQLQKSTRVSRDFANLKDLKDYNHWFVVLTFNYQQL